MNDPELTRSFRFMTDNGTNVNCLVQIEGDSITVTFAAEFAVIASARFSYDPSIGVVRNPYFKAIVQAVRETA